MNTRKSCQSCSMPLDNKELLGTEKDGSPSNEYCKYCYVNGAFVNPDMKLDEMKVIVRTQLEK
ncbi:MAG TPA: zinc ribbon domain-containing protein [Bacteroidia bacterium]|nr:zinc ribbon domain-containing protein [Bacteroidia bacterium]